jgi:tetratricopeptide (TPR) repeat protein
MGSTNVQQLCIVVCMKRRELKSMAEPYEDFADQLGRYLGRAGFTQQELAHKIEMHRNTIVKWMNRTSWPTSRGQVLRLADELFLEKQERKALLQAARFSIEQWPTEVWTVPQQRDMFFTGRDEVFQSLREHLVPGRTMALTQAISGLGGIGKTHTAVEYAYRFHRDYEAVLWLQADSWETLVSACVQLADELALPEQKEADQVVAEVQRWLRKHRSWLLIIDNVELPQEILSTFVPTQHHGSVLLTTRVHDVEPLAQTQILSTMSEDEGVLFLLRRTKKVLTKASLDQTSAAQQEEARLIWQLMDGLPLALDQAGAYILETCCSFSEYREQYVRRRAELLDRRGKRFIGHEASVATTFSLAFERVEALNPAAADLLRVCSLLASEAIPEEIFREGAQHLGPLLAAGGASWDLAIGVLHDYSLVQRNAEAQTLTVHRLVQAVFKEAMDATTSQLWAMRTVNAVNAAFPPVEHHLWPECDRLLPHALLGVELMERYQFTFPEATRLLNQAGFYLQERARYQEAGRLLERAFSIREQQLGPEHPNAIHSLNNLALLYNKQGKHAEAESLYERALAIREQQLGPEHVDTAASLNNLGTLYKRSGKYEQSEALYERALAIYERQVGPEHPGTATCLNNLASLYSQQAKYEQAEALNMRALAIYERQVGSDHPDTARSLNNLATLYERQGKYEQAGPLYERTLAIWERQLGLDHPDTALSLNNLASVYRRPNTNIGDTRGKIAI